MGAHASKGGDDRRCIKEAQILSGRERDGTDDSKPGKEWARHEPCHYWAGPAPSRLSHLSGSGPGQTLLLLLPCTHLDSNCMAVRLASDRDRAEAPAAPMSVGQESRALAITHSFIELFCRTIDQPTIA
jgi:hypothetical protein